MRALSEPRSAIAARNGGLASPSFVQAGMLLNRQVTYSRDYVTVGTHAADNFTAVCEIAPTRISKKSR
ncbi:MAG: hypothetical protein DLM52_12100 [Chthoniobacterales bacterium]|nr:MAG: hypothetical protein DLM52_12100 [Chthoniobacterales bacterium]